MSKAREKTSGVTAAGAQQARQQSTEAPDLYSLSELQQTVGNRGMLSLLGAAAVQPKLRAGQSTGVHVQAKNRLVGQRTGLLVQRKCAACATGAPCSECDEEKEERVLRKRSGLGSGLMVQRAARAGAATGPKETADTEASPTPAKATPSLIVDDEAQDVKPGQMRKSEFLSQLRTTVCSTAEQALAATMWSSMGCPYIERWLGHYSKQPSAYVERALRKYAPDTASARSAQDYIPLVAQRLRRGIEEWKTTGEVPEVPEELGDVEMPGVTAGGLIGGLLGGVVSGIGSALSGLFGGGGKAKPEGSLPANPSLSLPISSSVSRVLFKHHEGHENETADPVAIRAQLGNGGALDGRVRSRMQSAFGADFSNVRVHTDSTAQTLNESLSARAFTVGSDIAFAAGEYRPGTLVGDALIAHELAHVVQQGAGGGSSGPMQMGDAEPSSLEEDADISAVGAMVSLWGGRVGNLKAVGRSALPGLRSGLKLQRCTAKQTPAPSTLPKTDPTTPPQQPPPPSDSGGLLPRILEELGSASCDPDQGKMVVEIKAEKIPSCMLPCVNEHEQAHVRYGTAECTKVSAVARKATDAITEAEKAIADAKANENPATLAAAKAAQEKLAQVVTEFDKAVADYEVWFHAKCRENEGQAYQAGIDACSGAEAQKRCTDAGQKDRYDQMMKEWEEFKKNPPNCR